MFTPRDIPVKSSNAFTRALIEEQQQNLSNMHRFLLMRFEPRLEAAFEQFRYERLLKRIPIIGITGLVLFVLFSILDYYTLPVPAYEISIAIRLLVICPLIALIMYLGATRANSKLFFRVYFAIYLISAVAIISIIFAADYYGHFLPYDGILLHLVFGYFIMSLPYLLALYGGLFITLTYLTVSLYMALPFELLVSNCIFIVSLNFIGAIGCYLQERARRFLFLNENLVALSKAKDKKEIASKTRLVATASHDLRQPLHAMSLLIEALEDQLPEGQQRNLAKSIDISIKQLSHLLSTLLDISKLNAGIVEPRLEPVHLNNKVTHFCQEQFFRAKAEQIQLSFEGDETLYVSVDPLLLDRIIRNVVENIFVHAQASKVTIRWFKTQDKVRLEINDNGRGIAPEDLQEIFEEFHQSGEHTNSGMGLGLTIVKQLAELQGIQYGLNSSLGDGACFWFLLPLSEGKAEAETEPKISITIFNKQHTDFADHWLNTIQGWGYEVNILPMGVNMPSEHIAKMLPSNTNLLLWDVCKTEDLSQVLLQIREVRQFFQCDLPVLMIIDDDRQDREIEWVEAESNISEIVSRSVRPGKLRLVLSHLAAGL